MQIGRHLLLPGAVALSASTAIAVNHDKTFLKGERSTVTRFGDRLREHVLGSMAISALLGAAICAKSVGRTNVAAVLGAASLGTTLGTITGHKVWDSHLARQAR